MSSDLKTKGAGLKLRLKEFRTLRLFVQTAFLSIFVISVLKASYPASGIFPDNLFLRAEPVNALLGRGGHFGISFVAPAFILLFLTVFTGRFFCSYICPLGSCFDLVPSAGRFIRNSKKRSNPKARTADSEATGVLRLRGKYFLLVFVSALYVYGVNAMWFLNPIVIANRTVAFFASGTIPFVFIILIVIAILYKPRYWCTHLCPSGSALGIFSSLGKKLPLKLCPVAIVKSEENCIHCGKCADRCPFEIAAVADSKTTGRVHFADCSLCGNCVSACPCRGAISIAVFGRILNRPNSGSELRVSSKKAI